MNAVEPRAPYEIEVFFDGDCPLCRREIDFLRRRDRHAKIRFTDLMTLDFSSNDLGKSYTVLMAEIHGRLPNGQWLIGVEVFRRLYAAIGWRTPVMISRWPLIAPFLDWSYRHFAKYRLRLTGRCLDQCKIPPKLER